MLLSGAKLQDLYRPGKQKPTVTGKMHGEREKEPLKQICLPIQVAGSTLLMAKVAGFNGSIIITNKNGNKITGTAGGAPVLEKTRKPVNQYKHLYAC